jgi:hypothetical protein
LALLVIEVAFVIAINGAVLVVPVPKILLGVILDTPVPPFFTGNTKSSPNSSGEIVSSVIKYKLFSSMLFRVIPPAVTASLF